MKNTIRLSILSYCLLCFSFIAQAQDAALTSEYKEGAIQKLSELMNDFYIYPEVAKQTELHLKKQLKEGHFKQFEDLESFATALTESVQTINKDKHMRIRKNRPRKAAPNTPEAIIEDRLYRKNRRRSASFGFQSAKKMDGNVGYFDLRGFFGLEVGGPIADSYMNLLSTSDAIIVDLRENGGGSPSMVQYLCSYFFDKKTHLNSLYYREGDETVEYWTLEEVNGEKMPDVPLFVLTSEKTFSGAEEFSYNMQTQKRATLIGQTTGGGANPGGTRGINADLSVFIPTGRAINPITKTNWEGVGVIPEVQTPPEETMDKAHELAKIAAEEFRAKNDAKYKSTLLGLYEKLDKHTPDSSEEMILKSLKDCVAEQVIGEGDINQMGYSYLMAKQKPKTAEAIFKANTILYPDSPNVFDSYGEALASNGDLKKSIANYQKAVDIATKNEDPDVEFYIQNMAKVKKQLEETKKP